MLWLFAFFVMGSAASHWRVADKEARGLAQENQGRRSVRHALSNGGAAAFAGLMAWGTADPSWAPAIAAALASASADTLSSELGNVYGRRYLNIITFRPDERGRDGVISLEGTLFGVLGAAVIAVMYGAGAGDWRMAAWVLFAGVLGNAIDSVLGATLQRRGYMSNDTVNFANTAFAAWVATLL